MKPLKKAGIGIFFICLILAIWCTASSWERQKSTGEGFTAGNLKEFMLAGVLREALSEIEVQEYRNYTTETIESFLDMEKNIETSANAKDVLDFADIQQMEAGSVLDISQIEENQTDLLFYSEEPGQDLQQRIVGSSYQKNDNISMDELRYLRVLHVGADGQTHIGELLVNQSIADDVLEIMQELYENNYVIEKMVLVDEYGADDERSMEDNNTSAFNYREIAGTSRLSRHSLGLAIDINPLYNPYVKHKSNGETVISPKNAAEYTDRSRKFAYKIDENDLCYQLFMEHGFTWGGSWNSVKDYQHFEK